MAQQETPVDVAARHAADHADVEGRQRPTTLRLSRRHLAAHEEIYARHNNEHAVLAERHAAERAKAVEVTTKARRAFPWTRSTDHRVRGRLGRGPASRGRARATRRPTASRPRV